MTTSVQLLAVLESAVVDLAMSLPPMEHHVLRMLTYVPAMVARETVNTHAPTLPAHECAAALLAISCLLTESLVKVRILAELWPS